MLNLKIIEKIIILSFIVTYAQASSYDYSRRYDDRYNRNDDYVKRDDTRQDRRDSNQEDDVTLDQSAQNLASVLDSFFKDNSESENKRLVDIVRTSTNNALVYYVLKSLDSDAAYNVLSYYYPRGISNERKPRLTIGNEAYAKILTEYAKKLDLRTAQGQKLFVALKSLIQTTIGDDDWSKVNAALDSNLQDGSDLFDAELKKTDPRIERFSSILTSFYSAYGYDATKDFFKVVKDNTNDYFMYKVLYQLKAANASGKGAALSDKLKGKYFTDGKPQAVADFKITKDMYVKIIADYAAKLDLKDDAQKKTFKALKGIIAKGFGDKKWQLINSKLDPSLQDNTDFEDPQLNKVDEHLKNFVTILTNFYNANQYEPTKKLLEVLKKDTTDYFMYKLLYLTKLTDPTDNSDVTAKLKAKFFPDGKPQADDSVKVHKDFYIKMLTDYAATLDLTDATQQKLFDDLKSMIQKSIGAESWKKIQDGLDPSLKDKVQDKLFGNAFSSDTIDLKELKNLISQGTTDVQRLKAQFMIDFENMLLPSSTVSYTQADGTQRMVTSIKNLIDQYTKLLNKAQVDTSFLKDIQTAFTASVAQDTPLISGQLSDFFVQSLGQNQNMLMQFQAGYRVDIQGSLNTAATGKQANFDFNGLLLLCIQVVSKLEATANADGTAMTIADFSQKYPTALNQIAIMLKNRGNIGDIVKRLYTVIQQILPQYNAQIVFAANLFTLLDGLGFSDQQKGTVAQQMAQILSSRNINANDVNAYITKRKKNSDALKSLNQVDPQKLFVAVKLVDSNQGTDQNSSDQANNQQGDAITNKATGFLQNTVGNMLGKFMG